MNTGTNIVIVEDEDDIIDVLVYNLMREGFSAKAIKRGDEGLNVIRQELPDLVILDLMLPGIDGLSVCQQLKADSKTKDIPIIVVSAKSEDTDVVIGLGFGADDYLAKPFSPRELLARVKVALRRKQGSQTSETNDRLVYDELVVDSTRHEVLVSGELVKLTATEFRILYQLASNPRKAFTRERLLNRVVGDRIIVADRNIDVHIRSLRKKLDTAAVMIETIRGVGYRFSPE